VTGRPIPAVPWWASLVAVVLAVVLILKHIQGLLFLPVVLFVLWESVHNLQQALQGLAGDGSGRFQPLQIAMAGVIALALAASGWWVLTLVYAGSCAARWHCTGRGRKQGSGRT